jgi:hypothetical protein
MSEKSKKFVSSATANVDTKSIFSKQSLEFFNWKEKTFFFSAQFKKMLEVPTAFKLLSLKSQQRCFRA